MLRFNSFLLHFVLVLCALASAAGASSRTSGQEHKADVPGPEALTAARDEVRRTFAPDYAKAKSRAAEQELAQKLLSVLDSLDLVSRYAVLVEARELAIRGRDCKTALDAVERMYADYEAVDRESLRRETVLQIAPYVKQDQTAYVAEVGLELLEACLEREDLPPSADALQSARSLCGALSSPITKLGDSGTEERLRSAKRELEALEELAKAFQDLEANAKDPKANLVVGLHHAFVREDFARALPYLELSAEYQLANCVGLDLRDPKEPDKQEALADAWVAWSKSQEQRRRSVALERATYWYERALQGLTSLDHIRVDEKLKGMEPRKTPTPAAPSSKTPARPSEKSRVGEAIDLALAWLAGHQAQDGSWDSDGFMKKCRDLDSACTGAGGAEHDVGLTGLALLAFLDAGETHIEGRFKSTVKDGLQYLMNAQDDEGCFGERIGHQWVYDHACAARAMTEAFGMTRAKPLRAPAQKGVDFVLRSQNPYFAWRYSSPPDGDNDTSVTGWMVMVLKSAKLAGLTIDDESFTGALTFIDQMTNPSNGRTGYTDMGGSPSRISSLTAQFPPEYSESMTAAGVLVRMLAGRSAKEDSMINLGADLMVARLPSWERWPPSTIDFYYWYYGTQAMSRVGGPRWKLWKEALQTVLLDHQRSEESEHDLGSWDPYDAWSSIGGRVYSTALNCLSLEACSP